MHSRFFRIAAALWVGWALAPLAQAAGLVGTLPGSVSVDNKGSANYSIPLSIAPGRGGLQPSLSLNYSSGSGNGTLGVGWSLSTGFPQSITRGRTILARDGETRGVNFDANDKFYLDGKRLICVSDSYGEPGSTYRTEVDSFMTIATSGTGTDASSWNIDTFTVTDKSGTKFIFGKYSDSVDGYQSGGAENQGKAYAYALKRVEDPLGNYVSLSYSNPQAGEYVLSEVVYTGGTGIAPAASVTFTYTDDRPDKSRSYIGRRFTPLTKRLSKVDAATNVAGVLTTASRYTLDYDAVAGLRNSKLVSITPAFLPPEGGELQATPPTTFQWEDDQISFTAAPTGTPLVLPSNGDCNVSASLFGDVDGDGRDEMITVGGGISVSRWSGTTFGATSSWSSYGSAPIIKLCDVNGDGRKDIVFGFPPQWPCGGMSAGLYVLVSDGTKFVPLGGGTGAPTAIYAFGPSSSDFKDPITGNYYYANKEKGGISNRITVADFTGDGRDDILIHRYDGKIVLLRSVGTGFAPAVQYDVAASSLPGAFANWELTSVTFMGYSISNDFSVTPLVADLNGDGRMDYVWTESVQHVAFSLTDVVPMYKRVFAIMSGPGGGFSQRTNVAHRELSPSGPNPMQFRQNVFSVLPGDINGDGLTDLMVIQPNGTATEWPEWAGPEKRSTLGFSLFLSIGGNGAPAFNQVYLSGNSWTEYTVNVNGTQTVPICDVMEVDQFFSSRSFDPGTYVGPYEDEAKKAVWLMFANLSSSENASLEDVNGDGRADYLWYVRRPGSIGWWVMYSLGTTFSNPVTLPLGWTPSDPLIMEPAFLPTVRSRQSADVNGDGLPDTIATSGSYRDKPGVDGVQLRSGGRGQVLKKVVNGLGRATMIEYKAAKDDTIYTPGAAVSYPIREIRGSNLVVSDIYHDSGSTDADRAHFSYQYSGNRLDLSGRGGLGFHSFVTLDHQTSVFKYQFLTQSFPMTGLAMREQTYRFWSDETPKFRLISSHDNTVVFDAVSNHGTLFPFISKAVESRWEDSSTAHFTLTEANPETIFTSTRPAGAHITISAESWFDEQTSTQTTLPGVTGYHPGDTNAAGANVVGGTTSYSTFSGLPGQITRGNLTRLHTDYGDGFAETVATSYQATTSNGIANLVDTISTSVTSPGFGTESAPTKSFEYYSNTALVTKETLDASGGTHDLETVYERATDARHRVTAIKVSGSDLYATGAGTQSSTTYEATEFDDRFDLPTTEKDAYGHTTTTVYSPIFGKPTSVTDTNGVVVATTYDPLGREVNIVRTIGGTTLTTTHTYAWTDSSDPAAWNAVQTVAPPGGAGGLTLSCVYAMRSATSAQPAVTHYYDRLGRVLRTVKDGFGSLTATSDHAYNNLGQTVGVSLPSSDATRLWTRTQYDALGRATKVTAPNGTVTETSYNGRATIVSVDAPSLGGVDPGAQTNSTVVDAKGRTVAVWNADNVPTFSDTQGTTSTTASIAFNLDGFGRMRTTTLKGQTQEITAAYDPLGRQTSLNDPDKGNWLYENSPLGYVLKQTDAVGNSTLSTFDRLGRKLARVTSEVAGPTESAAWHYFEAADAGAPQSVAPTTGNGGWVGSLQRETVTTSGNPGFGDYTIEKSYTYDGQGRLRIQLHHIDDEPGANPGRWFYAVTGYDTYSRPTTRDYFWRPHHDENPIGGGSTWYSYRITTAYDARSYVTGVSSPSDNRTWWEAGDNGYDHLDRPVLFRKGSGHWTQRAYRAEDGVLTSITTGPTAGASSIQNLSFNYDGLGNLTSRTGPGGTETFAYDGLNRLTTSGEGAISYFDNGNIKNKSEVGGVTTTDYAYHSSKPHAVESAFGYTHGYDANGNLITRSKAGESWNLKYAGFDKPRWMAKVGSVTRGSEFLYDPNRSRAVQLEFDAMSDNAPSHYTRKRLYAHGAAMEVNYENQAASGAPTWSFKNLRIYIPGPDGVIGTQEFELGGTGSPAKALIYHQDHLGSIESITTYGTSASGGYATDNAGKGGRFNENAWGQRRDPLDWSGPPVSTDDGGADSLTPRGFTGHEMLDDLGLVHMNGRIYDPLLGRFLSADVVVQAPGSLQSYNRYSYVMNNPLTLYDPSGFYSILGLEFTDGGGVSGFFKDLGGYGGDVVMGAVGDNMVAGYKSGVEHMASGMTEIAGAEGVLDATIGTLHMVAGVGDAVGVVMNVLPSGKVEQAAVQGAEKLAVKAESAVSRAVGKAEGNVATIEKRVEGVVAGADSKVSRVAPTKEAEQAAKNRVEGAARQDTAKADLQKAHPDASVQSERTLRTSDGKKAVDPLTETGRRIDNVVIKDGKAVRSVETTSTTADKASQIAKENRIRENGGTFVRDKDTRKLVDLKDVPTELDRRR